MDEFDEVAEPWHGGLLHRVAVIAGALVAGAMSLATTTHSTGLW